MSCKNTLKVALEINKLVEKLVQNNLNLAQQLNHMQL